MTTIGTKVKVSDINGERTATITETGEKNGLPIVFLSDGTWTYFKDVSVAVFPLTVKGLRDAIQGLPDDTVVVPDWAHGPPMGDNDPAVKLFGFTVRPEDNGLGLNVLVDISRLDDIYDEADENYDWGDDQ